MQRFAYLRKKSSIPLQPSETLSSSNISKLEKEMNRLEDILKLVKTNKQNK